MFVSSDYIDPEFAPEQTFEQSPVIHNSMFQPQTLPASNVTSGPGKPYPDPSLKLFAKAALAPMCVVNPWLIPFLFV